jgi:hypothetical protein
MRSAGTECEQISSHDIGLSIVMIPRGTVDGGGLMVQNEA